MPAIAQRITPFLWFDDQAEEVVGFHTSIFKNSKVSFQLDGQAFTALNGGAIFKFNEAVSLVVHCQSQEEVDHYWARLTESGDPKA
ncbi:hypothetical protein BH24GEM1_BH24GEM1_09330 [soil metagenome]